MSGSAGDDGQGKPEGPVVAVFRMGRFGPERGTGRTSALPGETRASLLPDEGRVSQVPQAGRVGVAKSFAPPEPRAPMSVPAVVESPRPQRLDPRSEDDEGIAGERSALRKAPHSEPPASEIAAQALAHELQERLSALDALYAVHKTASHYALLGIGPTASPRQIRNAYFMCCRRFHPDTFHHPQLDPHRFKVEAVFARLTLAYETLRHPQMRADYDDSVSLTPSERYVPESSAFGPGPSELVPVRHPAEPPPARDTDRDSLLEVDRAARPELALRNPTQPPSTPASVRPPATVARPSMPVRPRNTSLSLKPGQPQAPAPNRSLRPSTPPRPSNNVNVTESRPMTLPRERAAASARAERDFIVEDESARPSNPGSRNPFSAPITGAMRNPFGGDTSAGSYEEEVRRSSTLLRELDQMAQKRLQEGADLAPVPGLLELANQVRGGGGMSKWAAARLLDAHQAEQTGRIVDAANLVRVVFNQLKDPNVEAHLHRLARLAMLGG